MVFNERSFTGRASVHYPSYVTIQSKMVTIGYEFVTIAYMMFAAVSLPSPTPGGPSHLHRLPKLHRFDPAEVSCRGANSEVSKHQRNGHCVVFGDGEAVPVLGSPGSSSARAPTGAREQNDRRTESRAKRWIWRGQISCCGRALPLGTAPREGADRCAQDGMLELRGPAASAAPCRHGIRTEVEAELLAKSPVLSLACRPLATGPSTPNSATTCIAGLRGGKHEAGLPRVKAHRSLVERHTAPNGGLECGVAFRPDTRWCSDAFEISYESGERVRNRRHSELLRWRGDLTIGGIDSGSIRDLLIESVEPRLG